VTGIFYEHVAIKHRAKILGFFFCYFFLLIYLYAIPSPSSPPRYALTYTYIIYVLLLCRIYNIIICYFGGGGGGVYVQCAYHNIIYYRRPSRVGTVFSTTLGPAAITARSILLYCGMIKDTDKTDMICGWTVSRGLSLRGGTVW